MRFLLIGLLIAAFVMLVLRSRKGTAQLSPQYRQALRKKTFVHILKSTYWFWLLGIIVLLFLEMDCVHEF